MPEAGEFKPQGWPKDKESDGCRRDGGNEYSTRGDIFGAFRQGPSFQSNQVDGKLDHRVEHFARKNQSDGGYDESPFDYRDA